MPVEFAREALGRLVERGVVDSPGEEPVQWSGRVTRYEAVVGFARALRSLGQVDLRALGEIPAPPDVPRDHPAHDAVRTCIAGGIVEEGSPAFRGDDPLTRLEFALWLDRLIGSPELPRLPKEIAQRPRGTAVDPRWGLHAQDQLSHPETFGLFSDIEDPRDRARVHRLVWWLIFRPPPGSGVRYVFLPARPVDWNEYAVCLDRALRYLDRGPPDTSTPEGSIEALKLAFWRADFEGMDRYLPEGVMDVASRPVRTELRTCRFSFVDAQETVDSTATSVEHLSEARVRVHLAYVPHWGDRATEVFEMVREGDRWVIAAREDGASGG
jgi:hypothetical protein